MPCNITSTIALDCIDNLGGVKAAWFSTDFDYTSITTGLTGIDSVSGGSGNFYEYQLPKDTANFVETFTISQTNGTAFYSQALTINLHKLETAKRNELLLLSKNRDTRAIFQDGNGKFWIMGLTRGASTTAGSSNTGTAPGDANNYIITLTADEPDMAYQIEGSTISDVDTVFTGVTFSNV